jgi:hypothetical protein
MFRTDPDQRPTQYLAEVAIKAWKTLHSGWYSRAASLLSIPEILHEFAFVLELLLSFKSCMA